MNRRRFLAATAPALWAWSAGCVAGDSEGPNPEVETVAVPAPQLPEHDRLDAPELPRGDEEPAVTEPVENRGDAGEVRVSLTLLEADGEGSYVGQTARARALSLDANERRDVTFSELPVGEYDRYQVETRPASLTATVRNRGGAGEIVVSVYSGTEDSPEPVDERAVEVRPDDTVAVEFAGAYVQFGGDELDVEAVPR